MKNPRTVYTNGTHLFTLENYAKTAGVCHAHGITAHKESLTDLQIKALHERGKLHYIFGIGDRKVLRGSIKRGKVGNFEVA